MWKIKKQKKEHPSILLMARYTQKAWEKIFPESNKNEWEIYNSPNDAINFIKRHVVANQNATQYQQALIVTIDDKYFEWLNENNKQQTDENFDKYVTEKTEIPNYWDERLIESNMLDAYHVLGISSLSLLFNLNEHISEYQISKETSRLIEKELQSIYQEPKVFCPGWIVKGETMPVCVKDTIDVANIYWDNNMNVILGKYLEQKYTKDELEDKLHPFYLSIPFVIKTKLKTANLNLTKQNNMNKENAFERQEFSEIEIPESNRISILKLLVKENPQIITIGRKATLPIQAFIESKINEYKKDLGII